MTDDANLSGWRGAWFFDALALKAASAASEAQPAACQQQDQDDDEKNREHVHLPRG